MRAEVTITFKNDLTTNTTKLLSDHFGTSENIPACANKTSLGGLAIIVNRIEHATINNNGVCLFFREELRVIKVHVENIVGGNVKSLRREIEDIISSMKRLAKTHSTKLDDAKAVISCEEGELQEAEMQTYFDKLKVSAAENIPTKIYVPLATFIASYWFDGDPKKALLNALVAIVATLLWVTIDALLFRDSFKYKEV